MFPIEPHNLLLLPSYTKKVQSILKIAYYNFNKFILSLFGSIYYKMASTINCCVLFNLPLASISKKINLFNRTVFSVAFLCPQPPTNS